MSGFRASGKSAAILGGEHNLDTDAFGSVAQHCCPQCEAAQDFTVLCDCYV